MIGITRINIQSIPCLVIEEIQHSQKALPLVVYFHGFTSAKEHSLPIAYLLAEEGYRVVLPDSHLHGERLGDTTKSERQLAFWDIVVRNVEELEMIKAYFDKNGLLIDHKIGVAGTSMGGITTAASLAKYEWIDAAAILMGTPALKAFAKQLASTALGKDKLHVPADDLEALFDELDTYDLSLHPERLSERPLLLWHGDNDPVVPFDQAHQFYKDLKPNYPKDQLRFIREVNRGHKVSRYAILETVKWFKKHLSN